MWEAIIKLVIGQLPTILPILGAVIGLVATFFGVKRSGAKEERAKIESAHYKEALNAERQRSQTESDVDAMSDVELERLRDKWTSS